MVCVFWGNTAASGESIQAATYKYVKAKPNVIVHVQPSKTSKEVARLNYGTRVQVRSYVAGNGRWYYIVL